MYLEDKGYSDLVVALKKDPREIVGTLTDIKVDAWHMVTGIIGEATELLENYPSCDEDEVDVENLVEELGDLCFYISGLYICLGEQPKVTVPTVEMDTKELYLQIVCLAGSVLDCIKKWIVYNEPYELRKDVLLRELARLAGVIHALSDDLGFSMKFIMRYNKAKLQERYGDKYSDAAAHNRADKV
jgi:NTP pyrophosphatase (non-canonical NTP hydrolase)